MIRERRPEDLDRLCDVLRELTVSVTVLAGRTPRDWLETADAECSWVFDQAPVAVTPTRNVVGHVQIYRPPDAQWVRDIAAQTSRQAVDLLVIGRLFVKPAPHDYGIARHLLRESVKYVESHDSSPLFDPADLAFLPRGLSSTFGLSP